MYNLLIVDDQIDLADDLAHMLPWQEVDISTVHKAYSAQDALAIIKTHPIDIIITDIRMPGMSGLELIEHIRKTWKNIKCILLSGHSEFEYAQKAIQHDAINYLLKPASDEELLEAVSKAGQQLKEQWSEVASHKKALDSLKENLPILRTHLLLDLLLGRGLPKDKLMEQLKFLAVPLVPDFPFFIMLVRMEETFTERFDKDVPLLEYATSNIADEIFSDDFNLWHCKDSHGYLIFLVQYKDRQAAEDLASTEHFEQKALQFQHYVNQYLKGTISLLISNQGQFPDNIHDLYEACLINFRQRIGSEREFLLTLSEDTARGEANTLLHLYDTPLLIHLLESGQWGALQHKLEAIFDELEHKWGDSYEHILETYFMIVSSLSYAVHKSKQWMSDILGDEFEKIVSSAEFHTIQQLREWTYKIIAQYRETIDIEIQDSRSKTVRQVQDYIASHLETASLQTIASHVYLNPSYLSKVYKMETGFGISDYLFQLKMERADYMLRETNNKVYEISASLGYAKTSYFIKVFKEKFGLTPQEYRDDISN